MLTRCRVSVVLGLGLLVAAGGTPVQGRGQAAAAGPAPLNASVDRLAESVMPQVIAWRRDFHEHPELSNREVRTSGIVAEHLRRLGLEVRTGVAKTGVVGVLRGGRPGRVVALRADMDALPVTEETDLPFRSRVTAEYNGQQVGVMHACGHDAHTAMLMGAAEVLASVKEQLPGTVVFVFQPAEEGAPPGEEGGAKVMVREGVLENPKVDAIFGLHVFASHGLTTAGALSVRPGGIMAASDRLTITVRGRQTHGAQPWAGIDSIVIASQIVGALQTIVSRQAEITRAPAVVTIGSFQAGTRFNIIPEEARLTGTVRTFDPAMQKDIHQRIVRTATAIAESAGATATVEFADGNPVTWNDPELTIRMAPTLERVAAAGFDPAVVPTTTAEDFAVYQQDVPGVFVFLGVVPKDADPATVAPNHSPRFFIDESALVTGVRALANLAVDYLKE
jgi:amidohydrolase